LRIKAVMMLLIMVLLFDVPAAFSEEENGGVSLSVTALNNEITALPGDTVVIPFSIENIGNTTVANITVYITGPAEGFQYSGKTLRMALPPDEAYNDTLILKVLNAEPGRYLLKIVARVGNYRFEAPVIVNVKPLIDYSLSVDVGKRYIYGHPVEVYLTVYSKSNTILTGRISYYVVSGGKTILNETTITFVKAGSTWVKKLSLENLPVGNYTVVLWANLSRLYKRASAGFEVYRRALNYSVRFESGAIRVFVYDRTGKGVPDIPVSINGVGLKTGPDGSLVYSVSTPGKYRVVLDLDGKIVSTEVEVKALSVSSIQEGDRLVVKVTDGKKPVSNVTVTIIGPKGKDFGVTNETGSVEFNASRVGYGTVVIRAESSSYLPAETIVTLTKPPAPTKTQTPVEEQTTTTSNATLTVPTQTSSAAKPWMSTGTAILLILSGLILAGASYAAFAMPVIHEETLDRYYFLKVRAPRLKPLRGYRIERPVKALEVKVTKGIATVGENGIAWELDLEPGEEAYLQALLG
jgi:hypothetical protein